MPHEIPSLTPPPRHPQAIFQPKSRLILLGASNLTEAASSIIRMAMSQWPGPMEVLSAVGHGRSFGKRSNVLGRALPSIVDCELWETLERRPPCPTYALISDIGNDLLYEQGVAALRGWVATCVRRLRQADARIAMTSLPLCNLSKLGPARFLFFRSLIFPGCRLSLEEVRRQAAELDGELRALAQQEQLEFVEQQESWYGVDPLHLRPSKWRAAYGSLLEGMGRDAGAVSLVANECKSISRINLWRKFRLARAREFTLCGVQLGKTQPAVRLENVLQAYLF